MQDRISARLEVESQPQEGDDTPRAVDPAKIYFEEVGGLKKQRVYGLGSQASSLYFASQSCSSSATSHPPTCTHDAQIVPIQRQMREMEQRLQQQQLEQQ